MVPGAALLALLTVPFIAAYALYVGKFQYLPCFALFGLSLGCALALWLRPQTRRMTSMMVLLSLLVAWSVSVSVGYRTPAMASGILVVVLAGIGFRLIPLLKKPHVVGQLWRVGLLLLMVAVVITFSYARHYYVYRDRPAHELDKPLGEVLAGGEHIYTNERTFAFLRDLDTAISRVETGSYAVIPAVACHWVTSRQPNPLPLDWLQSTELADQELVDRTLTALNAQRGRLTLIVQTVSAAQLAIAFEPLSVSDRYEVVNYVRENWRLAGRTDYFLLYR
jgi:hypothetical protein